MSNANRFEFLPSIPPTEENAIAIQALTLQDLTEGGFPNPTDLADPNDSDKVDTQLRRISQHPERYSGYRRESGLLVAYMKANEWRSGDELPFIQGALARKALQLTGKLRGGSLSPKAYGVFGLVADSELEDGIQHELQRDLLSRSIQQGLAHAAGVVNIALRDEDPLIPIALDLDFRPTDARGEAAGVPGVIQQRYQRMLTKSDIS